MGSNSCWPADPAASQLTANACIHASAHLQAKPGRRHGPKGLLHVSRKTGLLHASALNSFGKTCGTSASPVLRETHLQLLCKSMGYGLPYVRAPVLPKGRRGAACGWPAPLAVGSGSVHPVGRERACGRGLRGDIGNPISGDACTAGGGRGRWLGHIKRLSGGRSSCARDLGRRSLQPWPCDVRPRHQARIGKGAGSYPWSGPALI